MGIIKYPTKPVHITDSARKNNCGYQIKRASPSLFNSRVITQAIPTPNRTAKRIGEK